LAAELAPASADEPGEDPEAETAATVEKAPVRKKASKKKQDDEAAGDDDKTGGADVVSLDSFRKNK
jgi:hypothetical protein